MNQSQWIITIYHDLRQDCERRGRRGPGALFLHKQLGQVLFDCQFASYLNNNYRHSMKIFLWSKIDYFHCICDAEKASANEHDSCSCLTSQGSLLCGGYMQESDSNLPQTNKGSWICPPNAALIVPLISKTASSPIRVCLPLLGTNDGFITVTAGSTRLFSSFSLNLAKLLWFDVH